MEKEAINLKQSKNVYMRWFEGMKGKEEILQLHHNLKYNIKKQEKQSKKINCC